MRVIAIIALLLLTGCYDPERDRYFYTRADVDAINAQIACRNLARNMLQMSRCDAIRR